MRIHPLPVRRFKQLNKQLARLRRHYGPTEFVKSLRHRRALGLA